MLPALAAPRFTSPTMPMPSVFRTEVDDLFNQFFGGSNGDGNSRWNVPIAVWDDDKCIYVELDVPGVRREDLEIFAHQGTLRISGERKVASEEREYWHNDRAYGRFERLISLPDIIDLGSVEAKMQDGVLSITVTKRSDAQPKKIAIDTA